jgi:hypothetical protein
MICFLLEVIVDKFKYILLLSNFPYMVINLWYVVIELHIHGQ